MTLEEAYDEMRRRQWGFISNGKGFGDPKATYVMVGPYDGAMVEVWAVDADPIKAIEKAIEKEQEIKKSEAKKNGKPRARTTN